LNLVNRIEKIMTKSLHLLGFDTQRVVGPKGFEIKYTKIESLDVEPFQLFPKF
jgi:hypothetical protein